MRTDIIVPTFGQEEHTVQCFRALREHTDEYRLIWIDNGSGKESRDVVMNEFLGHRGISVWLPENIGFARAVNVGLRLLVERLGGGNIAILHNDAVVTAGWLDRLTRLLESDAQVRAAGVVTEGEGEWQSWNVVGEAVPWFKLPEGFDGLDVAGRAEKLDAAFGQAKANCQSVSFFCTLFRRDAFEVVGYLDDGCGLGADVDFCRRMKGKGMGCALSLGTYVPHDGGVTLDSVYSIEEVEGMWEDSRRIISGKYGEEVRV